MVSHFPLSKREITTTGGNDSFPFPSDHLAIRFHAYEIYVTGVIAIYFYDLILHVRKDWSWYSKKQWFIPDLVFFTLEKVNTLFYCIIVLFLLHYTHHNPTTCESTEIVSLCYYALGISLQCLQMLSLLRSYYSDSFGLLVSLSIYVGATSVFHVLNIFGFGIFTVGADGNCYLQPGQSQAFWVPIAFIMMATFSWCIFGLITARVYSLRYWNELEKMCWCRFLFDDGLSYLALNVAFQMINVIFILTKSDYIYSFINTTPALIITSICCQRLTVLSTSSIVSRFSTSSLLPYSTKKRSISRSNFPTPISPPQYNEHIINNIPEEFPQQLSTSQTHPPRIPLSTSRISQDFTNSLITIFSSFTITDNLILSDRLRDSLRSGFWSIFSRNNVSQPSVKSHKLLEGNIQESIRSSASRTESINSLHTNIVFTNDGNSSQTRGSIRSQKSDKSTLSPPQNVYSPEGERRIRLRSVMLDRENVYCFWYSNANRESLNEEDVFLFPPIPPKVPNNYEI